MQTTSNDPVLKRLHRAAKHLSELNHVQGRNRKISIHGTNQRNLLRIFEFAALVFLLSKSSNKSPFFFNLAAIVWILKSAGFNFVFTSFQSNGVDTVGE